jgi:xanthine/uracil/vitamin C permease (AzgA family)
MPGVLERLFHLHERRTTVATELRGGAVTFATMSYIGLLIALAAPLASNGALPVASCRFLDAEGSRA